jgi:hypothetical protein
MVAHRLGKADLGLPHAFGAALATAVEGEDDGPKLVVVAPPLFGKVDDEAVGFTVEFYFSIQEAGLLRRLGPGLVGLGRGNACRANPGRALGDGQGGSY